MRGGTRAAGTKATTLPHCTSRPRGDQDSGSKGPRGDGPAAGPAGGPARPDDGRGVDSARCRRPVIRRAAPWSRCDQEGPRRLEGGAVGKPIAAERGGAGPHHLVASSPGSGGRRDTGIIGRSIGRGSVYIVTVTCPRPAGRD